MGQSNIIISRKELIPIASKDDDLKNFQVGDYITDSHYEELYLIEDIYEKTYEDRTHRYAKLVEINPITFQKCNDPNKFSKDSVDFESLKNYYVRFLGDISKTKDAAHKIMFEGANIEENETDASNSDEFALMSRNNKNTLIALREEAEKAERSISLVKNYCNLITSRMRYEMESKIRQINGTISKMKKEIRKFDYVIQTIETYMGISEEITLLIDGEPASEDERIVIRQAVIFVDEELALIEDDFDWQKMNKFDDWLKTNDNYKRLLPDKKSIVALKPRRTDKTYSNDVFVNAIMNQPNHITLFLIRNGDRLYRLESEHIYLIDRLFPNANEFQEQLEAEQKGDNFRYGDDKKSDIMRKRFTKVAFLLQGLLDRSDVFSPHHVECSFLKMESIDESVLKMDYELDFSRAIGDGRLKVMDWIKETNKNIKEGSRILIVGDGACRDFLKYYSHDHSKPDGPGIGVYSVLKNPKYNPDCEEASWGYCRYLKDKYIIQYKPFLEAYSWTNGVTERKNKVSITLDETSTDWLLYDELDLDTLDYYLNCRLYRSQYYNYVKLLKTAKILIEKEKKSEYDFANLLAGEIISKNLKPKNGLTEIDVAIKAIEEIKKRLKWKRPISSKEKETYTLVRRLLFSKSFIENNFIERSQQ